MADLAEILMIDHMAVRFLKETIEKNASVEELPLFHDYLKNCHIELEEKILFPMVKTVDTEDKTFYAKVDQIKADHKLIETLYLNILKWKEGGNLDLVNERFPLFFRILIDHNLSEDEIVFPTWKSVSIDLLKQSKIDAINVVESFGVKNYLNMTGLSEKAYRYLFMDY